MTDDSKAIRDRPDKTPDHRCRAALLGATIKDVIQVCTPARDLPSRDSLYLVREDGTAIEIEAERLYFDLIDNFEGELAAIRIEREGGLSS